MKNFYVLTLFPEMIEGVLSHSIIGRAVKDGVINVECVNIRDFSTDKHRMWTTIPTAAEPEW